MYPTAFDESNALMSAPSRQGDQKNALDDSGVEVLSVWVGNATDEPLGETDPPGSVPVVVSCWKLTREELAEINRTGRVWLMTLGQGMAPTRLLGISPFKPRPDGVGEPELGGFNEKEV